MANPDHLNMLRQGVDAWNAWREREPLSLQTLAGQTSARCTSTAGRRSSPSAMRRTSAGRPARGRTSAGANFSGADLRRAILHQADLNGADLNFADLCWANLSDEANLSGANLRRADLYEADLRGAKLIGAELSAQDRWRAKKDAPFTPIGNPNGLWTGLAPGPLARPIGRLALGPLYSERRSPRRLDRRLEPSLLRLARGTASVTSAI
jgi:hypothetical protein